MRMLVRTILAGLFTAAICLVGAPANAQTQETSTGSVATAAHARAAAVNVTVRAYYPYNTLSSIGAKLCGSWTAWYGIYADNRARIGPNPNLIYPGMVLYVRCAAIPAAPVVRPSLSTGWVHPLPWARGTWSEGDCWHAPRGDHQHQGVDLSKPWGTPIRAAHRGRVDRAGWTWRGYGISVVLNHSGIMTHYAHMTREIVYVGQWVRAGQTIGYVGATGHATGPHLHFEVATQPRVLGTQINPAPYLRARGVNIGC